MKKSERMEQNAWDQYDAERASNPLPLANPFRQPTPELRKKASDAIGAWSAIDKKIRARLSDNLSESRTQESKENVSDFGLGCVVAVIVLIVAGWLVWASSVCPDSWACFFGLLW